MSNTLKKVSKKHKIIKSFELIDNCLINISCDKISAKIMECHYKEVFRNE